MADSWRTAQRRGFRTASGLGPRLGTERSGDRVIGRQNGRCVGAGAPRLTPETAERAPASLPLLQVLDVRENLQATGWIVRAECLSNVRVYVGPAGSRWVTTAAN